MTDKNCENCKFYDEDIDTQPCCSCRDKENFEADNNVGGKIKDKDIIKELQCVSEWFTEHGKNTNTAVIEISKKAIELINQQQAEIERLIHNLEAMAVTMRNSANATKIEAYKEFADRLKEKASKGFWDELAYVDTEKIDDVYKELTERKED